MDLRLVTLAVGIYPLPLQRVVQYAVRGPAPVAVVPAVPVAAAIPAP